MTIQMDKYTFNSNLNILFLIQTIVLSFPVRCLLKFVVFGMKNDGDRQDKRAPQTNHILNNVIKP